MSNKERGLHGNCYCTFDLRVRWLRWTCRRDGDSMKVGDLVRFSGMEAYGLGIIIRRVAMYADTVEVLWANRVSKCSTDMLEVVNASR